MLAWPMRFNYVAKTGHKLQLVRILSLILRGFLRVLGRDDLLILQRQSLTWQLDAKEAIDCCLILTGEYEPEVLRMYGQTLKKGDVVLDIGANIGAHTLPMANLLGESGRLYAFEATEFALEKLHKNIALNPHLVAIISPQHIFLNSGDGKSDDTTGVSASWSVLHAIKHHSRHQLDGGFKCHLGGARKMSLDMWVVENNIDKINLIKIDVDGNEVSVIKGALHTLKRFRPIILMELSPIHYEEKNENFVDQLRILKDIGYSFFDEKNKLIDLGPEEIEKNIPRGVLINVYAVAK